MAAFLIIMKNPSVVIHFETALFHGVVMKSKRYYGFFNQVCIVKCNMFIIKYLIFRYSEDLGKHLTEKISQSKK